MLEAVVVVEAEVTVEDSSSVVEVVVVPSVLTSASSEESANTAIAAMEMTRTAIVPTERRGCPRITRHHPAIRARINAR